MANPLYRQIADDLRGEIESGRLTAAGQLPSEAELRKRYGNASRNTVRQALALLANRGLVESRAGQGTFVAANADPFITAVNMETGFGGGEGAAYASEGQQEPDVSPPKIEIQLVSGVVAEELHLDEDVDEVVSRHQQRFIGDQPWSLQTSFYPMALVERGAKRLIQAKNINEGAVRYIQHELKITEVGTDNIMLVRAPTAEEADFFALPEDSRTAVFETRQVGIDETGTPLRATVSIYAADRNRFAMRTGQRAKTPPATSRRKRQSPPVSADIRT